MLSMILKRLAVSVLVLLAVSFVVFVFTLLLPGDPAQAQERRPRARRPPPRQGGLRDLQVRRDLAAVHERRHHERPFVAHDSSPVSGSRVR